MLGLVFHELELSFGEDAEGFFLYLWMELLPSCPVNSLLYLDIAEEESRSCEGRGRTPILKLSNFLPICPHKPRSKSFWIEDGSNEVAEAAGRAGGACGCNQWPRGCYAGRCTWRAGPAG